MQRASATCVDFLDALESCNLEFIHLGHAPGPKLEQYYQSLTWGEDMEGFPTCTFKNFAMNRFERAPDHQDLKAAVDMIRDKINGRLDDPNDPTRFVIHHAQVLDTKIWPRDREDLAAFGDQAIQQLAKHFRIPLERMTCRMDLLAEEWTTVKAHLSQRNFNGQLPPISALYQGDQNRYKNIMKLVGIVLTIPVSSSSCERAFSALKRVKSDWRSNLTTAMLNHLLTVVIEGPESRDFPLERAVELWWRGGQRRRRPMFLDEDLPHEDQLFMAMANGGI